MSGTEGMKKLYVRANPESRRALKLVRARLLALVETEDVSQEEMVAASWLWMATLDAGALARDLAPFVAKIRGERVGDPPRMSMGEAGIPPKKTRRSG